MMGKRYLFQSKTFWAIWLAISLLYVAFYLSLYVQIYSDIAFDITVGKSEPIWHLLLRSIGIIEGGEYAGYSPSIEPIINGLPYTVAFYGLVTLIVIVTIYLIQNLLRHLMNKIRRSNEGATSDQMRQGRCSQLLSLFPPKIFIVAII